MISLEQEFSVACGADVCTEEIAESHSSSEDAHMSSWVRVDF